MFGVSLSQASQQPAIQSLAEYFQLQLVFEGKNYYVFWINVSFQFPANTDKQLLVCGEVFERANFFSTLQIKKVLLPLTHIDANFLDQMSFKIKIASVFRL